MRILKIDRHRISRGALAEAAAVLRSGGAVVIPTDTAYGLAADPANAKAMKAVFAIKGRPKGKPLPFIAASLKDVAARFVLSGVALRLARRHWPGPLTVVVPYKKGTRSGAVRVPASVWARALAKAAGGLITSTSANVSGTATLYDPRLIAASFRGRRRTPDLMLDAGKLPARKPSTIVRVKRGTIEVLRQGSVKVES